MNEPKSDQEEHLDVTMGAKEVEAEKEHSVAEEQEVVLEQEIIEE